MFDINTGTFNFERVSCWVDLVLTLIILAVALYFLLKVLKRKFIVWNLILALVLLLVGWFFDLRLLWSVALVLSICVIVVSLVINQGAIRDLTANSLASQKKLAATEKVFDRHALLMKIDTAVQNLSKNKIGAIITFEKDTKLDDFIKSGTILNAPVTPELLMTIFYPGTRLHDGAVVIRRDTILAASVYYTPTTKPLTGKFGSRHRAAIGISEVSDSVTVVVSEETGRISIAVAGELIHVPADTFLRTLEDYILATPTQTEQN